MSDFSFTKSYKRYLRYLFLNALKCNAAMIFVMLFCVVSVFAGGDHTTKGWVAEDTYKVLNFLVLFTIIFFVVRKPISRLLSERIEGIKTKLEDLDIKKNKLKMDVLEYTEKLNKLDEESKSMISNYIKQGEESRDKIIAEAEVAISKLKEQAKKNIEQELLQVRARLQHEIINKTFIEAEKIIKEQIALDDHKKIIDEYLDKVVA